MLTTLIRKESCMVKLSFVVCVLLCVYVVVVCVCT